jgi:hypothetical protein
MVLPVRAAFYDDHTYEECASRFALFAAVSVMGTLALTIGMVGRELQDRSWATWPKWPPPLIAGTGALVAVLSFGYAWRWLPINAVQRGTVIWALTARDRGVATADIYSAALDEAERRNAEIPTVWPRQMRGHLLGLVSSIPVPPSRAIRQRLIPLITPELEGRMPDPNEDPEACFRMDLQVTALLLQEGYIQASRWFFDSEAYRAHHRRSIPPLQLARDLRTIPYFHNPIPGSRAEQFIRTIYTREFCSVGTATPDMPLLDAEIALDRPSWEVAALPLRKLVLELTLPSLIIRWVRLNQERPDPEVARKLLAWYDELPHPIPNLALWIAQIAKHDYDTRRPDPYQFIRYVQVAVGAAPDRDTRQELLRSAFQEEWARPQFKASVLPQLMRQNGVEMAALPSQPDIATMVANLTRPPTFAPRPSELEAYMRRVLPASLSEER